MTLSRDVALLSFFGCNKAWQTAADVNEGLAWLKTLKKRLDDRA
jgi:hypothetical protein